MKHTLSCFFMIFLLSINHVIANTNGLSKQQAMNIAQQKNPGRVLSVKLDKGIYRVKTLSANGEVRIIRIDATNGKIIPTK